MNNVVIFETADNMDDSIYFTNIGKELIAQYCKAKSINLTDINKPEYQSKVMRKYGFHDWDSALATLGHGGLKEGQVVNKMVEEYEKAKKKEVTDAKIMEPKNALNN